MLFSVIIPTYNRAALLLATLDSVFAQNFKDYEVIVVDDGSTDDTTKVLEPYRRKLHVFRQPNRGPGAARNLGASHAKGQYLAFLDSDDLWFPWTLVCLAELIRRYDWPSILSTKLVEFFHESNLASVNEAELKADGFSDYLASHRSGYFIGAGMSVLKHEEFIKTGGYTQRRLNCEDHDLILCMGTARGFVQMLSPVTLAWRRHLGSQTMTLSQSVEGIRYLIEQERRGAYPGGASRTRARRDIITRHARPISLELLRSGQRQTAWELYRAMLGWHIRQGRWRYLLAFPRFAAW